VTLTPAIAEGKSSNCYAGLHENYADYYPNYPQFTTAAVGLTSSGQLTLSYLNPLTDIQSFGTKAAWLAKNASTQSPEIHARYGTSASFIDVNSAMVPWWRADMDARSPGAGMFSAYANGAANLWAFERQTHGGPVFGEGRDHWAWSGLLDGVEAQLGAGGTPPTGNTTPLFVDFDLLKIHPLQVNHGMGYYERWMGPNQSMWSTSVADEYRMQEVAFGHAPYMSDALWENTDRVLLEYNLISPLAARYGVQPVTSIAYRVNGVWVDSSAAALQQNLTRALVTYGNGDTITANAQPLTLVANGLQLPQYGWSAVGQNLLAYTAIQSGVIVDYSQVGNVFFANARNQMDLFASGSFAQPTVKSFAETGARSGQFQAVWNALDTAAAPNYLAFVHFVDNNNNVAFQADHSLPVPTSQWRPGQVVPDMFQFSVPSGVPNGNYSVRIGLYSGNVRSLLLGTNDGTERYILGTLTVQNSNVSFSILPMSPQAPDPRLNSGGTLINFGPIQTDGMVSVTHQNGLWILRVYPQYRNVIVRFSNASFPAPATVTCQAGGAVTRPTASAGGYWQVSTLGATQCTWPK
jgi:hypothetical protein